MVIELTTHAGADTRDDVPAGLQMRLIVLVAASERMQVRSSLGIVERKLELSTIVPRRRLRKHERRDRGKQEWVDAWWLWRRDRRIRDPTRQVRAIHV